MCVDASPAGNPHQVLHDVGPAEVIGLEPVDSVTVTTLMDNALDLFMPDQGPAMRTGLLVDPRRECAVMVDREVPDALVAEHGLALLVTVTKGGHEHRILFDTGVSPDGVLENMRRLDVDPSGIEAIVCSTATSTTRPGWPGCYGSSARPGCRCSSIRISGIAAG